MGKVARSIRVDVFRALKHFAHPHSAETQRRKGRKVGVPSIPAAGAKAGCARSPQRSRRQIQKFASDLGADLESSLADRRPQPRADLAARTGERCHRLLQHARREPSPTCVRRSDPRACAVKKKNRQTVRRENGQRHAVHARH